jgi:alkylhydroperoxidase family enzyme
VKVEVHDPSYVSERVYARTRLPEVEREDLSPDEQVIFDRITAMEGATGKYREDQRRNYYRMLLNSPLLADQIALPGAWAQAFSPSLANLELMTVAAGAPCRFLLIGHVPDAIASGVRPEAVKAILEGDDDALHGEERLLVRCARQVANRALSDDEFKELEKLLGRRTALEYIFLACFISGHILLYSALGIPEPSPEAIDDLLRQSIHCAETGTPAFGIDSWATPTDSWATPTAA